MADTPDPEPAWSPPKVDETTGTALYGDYPLNRRRRAETLSREGKAEDPDGLVSPELIAATGTRLEAADRAEAERVAAEEKARPPLSASMKVADIEAIAKREGVDISDATNNDQRVELIEAARAAANTGA